MRMIVRKAKLKDAREVSYLTFLLMKHHARLDKYWEMKKNARQMAVKFIKKSIKSRTSTVFVAEDNGRIVGYVLGDLYKRPPNFKMGKVGHLYDAYVLPAYRKRGMAKKLVAELFKWFKSKGMTYVSLETDIRNKVGLAAWKRLKFKEFMVNMKRKL
jgi:ribosomal protein S18 acetylase RimI-like enzyme